MTLLEPLVRPQTDEQFLLVTGGFWIEPLTGTASSIGSSKRFSTARNTCAGHSAILQPLGSVAMEVQVLQDEIKDRARLTRQQIAAALGVDRRSLSAWANGESIPSLSRIDVMRFLAATVRQLDSRNKGRAHELLVARHGNTTILSAITAGRLDIAEKLLRGSGLPRLVFEPSPGGQEPLHSAALRALASGALTRPQRNDRVRELDEYQSELSSVHAYLDETSTEPSRRDVR